MKAPALKNRGGTPPERAGRHPRVVGDQRVHAGAAGGANVGRRVEREWRHVQTHAVRATDVVRRHGPLGRDEVVVVVGRRLEERLVDRLHGEQAGPDTGKALPGHVEIRRDEALDDELAARNAAREHRVHDLVRVRRRGVEVGVPRDVLDLEVHLGPGPPCVLEQRPDRDDRRRPARGPGGQRAARAAEDVGPAAGQLRDREGAHLAACSRWCGRASRRGSPPARRPRSASRPPRARTRTRAAFLYAARLSSAKRALPFTTVPPRWAWMPGWRRGRAARPRGSGRARERGERPSWAHDTVAPVTAFEAIIVGGGHNGLTCAAYLARAGLDVCVLERRHVLGGACVTEEVWPGQRVSRASYVVSMLQPKIVSDLRLHEHGYQAIPLDPSYATFGPDGRPILFATDLGAHARVDRPLLAQGRGRVPGLRGAARREPRASCARCFCVRRRRSARSAPATCSGCCARPAAPPASLAATCSSCSG